jgi:adenylate kinase
MRKYIIMGVQGSGKGTQAKLLAETLDLEHVSVGDIFRWNVQHHTKLGAQVRRSVAAGELVSDDLVETVVHRRLSEHDWNYGFIIDGFPRNQPQARFFLESYDLDAVILLEVPDQLVRDRILSRRLCSECGVDYNLISHRPATAGVCDVCGGELVARADDTPEAVEGRLRDYHDKTRPILDLFRARRSSWRWMRPARWNRSRRPSGSSWGSRCPPSDQVMARPDRRSRKAFSMLAGTGPPSCARSWCSAGRSGPVGWDRGRRDRVHQRHLVDGPMIRCGR